MPSNSGILEPKMLTEMRAAKSWGVEPWDLERYFELPRWTRAMVLSFEREDGKVRHWSVEWSKN